MDFDFILAAEQMPDSGVRRNQKSARRLNLIIKIYD
jgi:hypothetical protein